MKKINVKNVFLLLLFLGTNDFFFGQGDVDSISTWKKYRKQIFFGGGATQFLGDLGGGNTKGKKYGLGDIDWESTKYEFHVGYRYLFTKNLSISTKLTLGSYAASDFHTTNFKRSQRKIDIKGSFVEWSERLELVFYSHYLEKKIKDKTVCKRKEFYIFSGIGFLYFNSQAGKNSKYEGFSLRPLSTEGQGLPGGTIPYKNHSITIPFGIGMQKSFSRRRSIKLNLHILRLFQITWMIQEENTIIFNLIKLFLHLKQFTYLILQKIGHYLKMEMKEQEKVRIASFMLVFHL